MLISVAATLTGVALYIAQLTPIATPIAPNQHGPIWAGIGSPIVGAVQEPWACAQGNILYVNASAVGANNGTSWENAYQTLQDALLNPQAGTDYTEVWVAKGAYYPDEGATQSDNNRVAAFYLRNCLSVFGGFDGTETLREQRDWVKNPTVLSGDIDKNDVDPDANHVLATWQDIRGANSQRIVVSVSNDSTPVLDGFILTGGSNVGSWGGGVFVNESKPILRNLTVIGNEAKRGGGLYSQYGSPLIGRYAR